ncbi:hypothetical protein Hanom_Chr17g01553821 [Helianthus anomalus]
MGDCQLKVNIAKFAVENADVKGVPVGGAQAPKPTVAGVNSKVFGGKDFRSYSEVVGSKRMGGDTGRGGGSYQVPDVKEEERTIVVPDKMVAFGELRGLAVVGMTVWKPWDKVGASAFLNSRKVWEPWFSKLGVWDGQSLPVFRVWVEEELEDWIPDYLGVGVADSSPVVSSAPDSLIAGKVDSSPLASPVARFSELGSQGGGEGNHEGSSMKGGAANRDKSAGVGTDGVRDMGNVFNYDSFLGNERGSIFAATRKKGLFVFKSVKKPKRYRKIVFKNQGSPFFHMDSSEKSRPNKRNRAQIEEDSDPFSLDKLLGPKFNTDKREDGDQVLSGGGSVEPLNSDEGRPFDLNHRVESDMSSSSMSQGGDRPIGGSFRNGAWKQGGSR